MDIKTLNYNYVIIGCDEYYLVGYHDIITLPCVSYHTNYYDGFDSFWERQLVRWNFSRKINQYVHTPFSRLVYPKLYPHHFTDNKPICFLFFGNRQQIYQTDFLKYIRKNYKDSKIVLYMQDLVARNSELHFDSVNKQFDLLLSYDKGDAAKYNMHYYPTPMSYYPISEKNTLSESDIYFCGKGKDRYILIHNIYEQCSQVGLICDFYITEMPASAPRISGIHYNQPLSYIENLEHIVKTKCILEIMQGGADGYTPRTWESIMYDKHLLTNNTTFEHSLYYFSYGHHNIQTLKDSSILHWINTAVTYPYELKKKISPINLLYFIDKKLQSAS